MIFKKKGRENDIGDRGLTIMNGEGRIILKIGGLQFWMGNGRNFETKWV